MTWVEDRSALWSPVKDALVAQGVQDVRLSGQTGGPPSARVPWARITFVGGFAFYPEVGDENERGLTTMLTEIYTPSGRAPGQALALAEVVRSTVRAIQVVNLVLSPSRIVQESSEGEFYRVLVASPFEVDVFV